MSLDAKAMACAVALAAFAVWLVWKMAKGFKL